jgi:hypothetical protein
MPLGLCLDDNYIVFKTLNENEYKLLKYYTDISDNAKVLLYKLALSTFMINGNNVLNNRTENVPDLFSFYESLPYKALYLINEELDKVYAEYIDSLKYFEGFCYTDKSEYLWKVLNKNNPIDNDYFGITGCKTLGLNSAQENWIIINQKLDNEEQYEQQFHLSVLVASSFNPKGAKSISREFESKKQELEDVRVVIAEYGYDKKRQEEEKKTSKWTAPIRTKEDLVRELNRQMRGEKDNHDIFINNWINKQKKLAEEAQKSVDDKQKEYRKKMEDIELTSNLEDSRIITEEETKNLTNKLKTQTRNLLKETRKFKQTELNSKYIKKLGSRVIQSDK